MTHILINHLVTFHVLDGAHVSVWKTALASGGKRDFSVSLKCKLVVLKMKPLERRDTSKVKLSWKIK